MSDRKYYLVPPDSPVMAKIQKMLDQKTAFRDAAWKIAEEFGAEQIWTTGPFLSGLDRFKDGVSPEGWREDRRRGYYVPDAKSKAGKIIRDQIKALPRNVDGFECSRIMGFSHWADGRIYFPVPEKIGEQWVVSVHEDQPEFPEGCRLLKRSEYWEIKEAADADKQTEPDAEAVAR